MPEEEARARVEALCVLFHGDVERVAEKFTAETGQHYHATTSSYLAMLGGVGELLESRGAELLEGRQRCAPAGTAWVAL